MPEDVSALVIAALAATPADESAALLTRAAAQAKSTRDRQLVAIAGAHLRGDHELVDALAREHLVDHPDSVLVARIAAAAKQSTTNESIPLHTKETS